MTLKPGQELLYAPISNSAPRAVTVERVGRKWAHIGHGMRVDKTTMVVVGKDYHYGRCYLSEAEFLHEEKRLAAWRALRDAMSRRPFDRGISLDAIRHAAALLGMGDCIPEETE